MTGEGVLFWLFALTTCGGAIAVVVNQNVVRMAFWLVVALGSIAALYFLLHADFVATTQLMIYVGGTVVLLIFGVMLTASGPYVKIKTSPADLFMSAGLGVLVLFLLIGTVCLKRSDWEQVAFKLTGNASVTVPQGYNPETQGNTARPIGLKLLGVSLGDLSKEGQKGRPAVLSPGYLLPFEIVSIHLLVVLIGAGYLARAKRRVSAEGLEVADVVGVGMVSVPASVDAYAGFFRRAAALLVDMALILVVEIFAIYIWWPPSTTFSVVATVLVFLYFAGMESSAYQGTIGKVVLGVAVTDLNGEPVTFARALARNLLKYVSGVILLIGYIMAALTKRRQALHDLLAKTLVVNR